MSYDPKLITGVNHRDLDVLHPIVAEKAKQFLIDANEYLKQFNITCKPVSTLRTWPEQNAIYAKGRDATGKKIGTTFTNAKAGDSIHNWGCAFDIGLFDGTVAPALSYNTNRTQKYYTDAKLVALAKKQGLQWGGDWATIKDNPHYSFLGNNTDASFIKRAKAGESIDSILKV